MMAEKVYIKAAGGIYFSSAEYPDIAAPLKAMVRDECQGSYRRIDRFIQLSLLAGARCLKAAQVNEQVLPPSSPLVLSSGQGPTSNNIGVQECLFRDRQEVKPLQFVNTLSNAAGFYMMKEAGLDGASLFVNRSRMPLEAAVQTASSELAVDCPVDVLLGVTDELSYPLSDQRLRMGLPDEAVLAEGSYCFYLSNTPQHACASINAIESGLDWALMLAKLSQFSPDYIHAGRGVVLDELRKVVRPESILTVDDAVWDGMNAAALYEAIQKKRQGELCLLSCSNNGLYTILKVSLLPA